MTLRSPKHPEIDDVDEAIEYYYAVKHNPMRKIAAYLGLSYSQVRRALIRRGVDIRQHQGTRTNVLTDGTKTRECRACGCEHPLTDKYFHRDSTAAGGFVYVCKTCRNEH